MGVIGNSESPGPIPVAALDERLESWKEIASYLKRSVRTVRRWERDEGLPVHRHVHRKMGTVYAYRREIDAWRARRGPHLQGPPAAMKPATWRLRRPAALVALVLIGLVVALVFRWWPAPSHVEPAAADRSMLAVLPFRNLSADPDQEYFSDGLTDEMITELGRIHPERLGVIARSSVMQYKETTSSAQQIGRELGVEYLLEGSVRHDGGRVRISAQLVRASDQSHLWAESYDRSLSDILDLQRDVALSVAAAIRLQLAPEQRAALARARTVDPIAYEAYLRGHANWAVRTPEGLQRARVNLERSVEADPQFALAHAALAGVFSMMSYYGLLPVPEALDRARGAALRALALDADLAEAHTVLAAVKERLEWQWAEADEAYRRAIELNPNYATAHHWYGLFLERMGRVEEAKPVMQRALALDPLSPIINKNAADPYFYGGEYERAIEQYRRMLELWPDFSEARLYLGLAYQQRGEFVEAIVQLDRAWAVSGQPAALAALGHVYAQAGRPDEARQILAELERLDGFVDPFHAALVHAGLGETDEAFGWFEAAFEARSVWLLHLMIDPRLRPLRDDPRYEDLVQRMDFPA